MSNLQEVEGIGEKTEQLLNKLNIYTTQDLISHYPFRYEILRRSDIENLKQKDKIIIDGVLEGQPTVIFLSNKLKKIIFRINTGKNILNITVYNKIYLMDELKYGKEVTIIGIYDKLKNTVVASEVRFEKLPATAKIEPVYYTTHGLSKKMIGKYISNYLDTEISVIDYIPEMIREKYNFSDKLQSLKQIHNPDDILSLKKARQRLKYEELFIYLLKLEYLKRRKDSSKIFIARDISRDKIDKFIDKLPFKLTSDQNIALEEIIGDLRAPRQMNRLLQGDVGCGKTIVAFLAAYYNYLSGYQTAMMVPTEILANQHYENALNIFKDTKMKIELLTSSTSKKKKDDIYMKLNNKEIDFIIGTQSLLNDNINYSNLGFVITDEQHRFGVNQRNIFKNKGECVDILSMSATPIPRTYALTLYGDLDISSIKTKPSGRKEVKTIFKKEKDIINVLELMKKELDLKHQIYVIAPMINNDDDSKENVKQLEKKMNLAFGKLYNIDMIHGEMDPKEKQVIMNKFNKGNIDILISTTVIEVGVNVPNASMIVIFDANLFGLSTLHQLRGRVGRGDIESYCILVAKESQDRLKFLESTSDGFEISEYDFKNRGEGDLFGIRQSGIVGLKLANVKKDFNMLLKVKEDINNFADYIFNNEKDFDIILDELKNVGRLN